MGYTHYWRRPKKLNAAKFAAAIADCKKICESIPVPLGDGSGEGEPEFSRTCLCFNGSVNSQSFSRDAGVIPWPSPKAEGVAMAGDNAAVGNWFAGTTLSSRAVDENGDGSYETFRIEQEYMPYGDWDKPEAGKYFGCCKTGYRPYDLLVQCCLIVFKEHFSDEFIVSSDGDQSHWNEAADGCQVFLGYGLLFELDQ